MRFFHSVLAHVEGGIRYQQDVVCNKFLCDVVLVATTNGAVIDALVKIGLQDVPQSELNADLGRGLSREPPFLYISLSR